MGDYLQKVKPNYYYGFNTDSIWTVNLDSTRICIIKDFIQKARELNGECPIATTSIDRYKITIHNDTTYNILGYCDWVGLDYFSFEKILFREHFEDLDKKRYSLKDSVNQVLRGHWIVTGLSGNIKRGDLIYMEWTDNLDDLETSTIVWEFSNNYKFRSYDNKFLNLTYSTKYSLIVDYGYLSLCICAGTIEKPNGDMKIVNNGAYFEFKKIEPKKVSLEFWSR
ncbi:MAG: hypothetical protein K8R58_12635 [Bacteroidales bacterium]|nr:hypothetical protein [Bacteroidales bacterium]